MTPTWTLFVAWLTLAPVSNMGIWADTPLAEWFVQPTVGEWLRLGSFTDENACILGGLSVKNWTQFTVRSVQENALVTNVAFVCRQNPPF